MRDVYTNLVLYRRYTARLPTPRDQVYSLAAFFPRPVWFSRPPRPGVTRAHILLGLCASAHNRVL
jgi:hypothetical protein